MSDLTKRIFLGICIILPLIVYSVYYYSGMISNAAFRYSDLESIEITWGYPGEMLNHYNTTTREYQYLNKEDSLIRDTVKLRDNDLHYLHSKAQHIGFFNVDSDMTSATSDDKMRDEGIPRYILTYTYKEKTKSVTLDADYPGNQKMKDAAKTTVDEVLKMIADAHVR